MTAKTADLCQGVMERILEVINEASPGERTAVELIASDYEEAILSSLGRAFPTA